MKVIDYLAEYLKVKQSEPVVDFLHEQMKHEAVYGTTFEDREHARQSVEAVEASLRNHQHTGRKVMGKAAGAGK